MNSQSRALFVTGTDTDVGKTFVSSIIVRELREASLRVGAFKPACSGSEPNTDGQPEWRDVMTLADAAGAEPDRVCPQCFEYPAAPPIAAAREGRRVDLDLIDAGLAWWQEHADLIVVEGVGGFCCPLTESKTLADWVKRLAIPVLVVVDNRLGAINHAILTVEAIRTRQLQVAGVVMNDASPDVDQLVANTNAEQIQTHADVPILGHIPHNSGNLCPWKSNCKMDWTTLFGRIA